MDKIFIGVDIGGTKIAVSVADANGEIFDKLKFGTQPLDPAASIAEIKSAIRKLAGDFAISAIGISCGGPLDSKSGTILSPPNLSGWDNVKITEILQTKFNAPAFLQNDANACALAEWRFGAGRGCRNMIFLTFGTGIGAGLILDGRLYSGTSDMAGEIGHVRMAPNGPVGYGKSGSFEGFCSGAGIAQYGYGTAREVAEKARNGDSRALEIYRDVGRNLGRGLSILIDILNPERIVIGSIFARAGDLMEVEMLAAIREESLPRAYECCEIVPAQLGESIGDIAAIAVAIDGLGNTTNHG